MKCLFSYFLLMAFGFLMYGQVDSISYKLDYALNEPILHVEQDMYLYTDDGNTILNFYTWANAYKDRTTVLSNEKLNQGDDALYFSSIEERGWLENIRFLYYSQDGKAHRIQYADKFNEMVQIKVPKEHSHHIKVIYDIHLPSDRFTGYGMRKDGSLLLKYFFIQPAYKINGKIKRQSFRDFESLTTHNSNYRLFFDPPPGFVINTDLQRIDVDEYVGLDRQFFQIGVLPQKAMTTIHSVYGTIHFDKRFPVEDKVLIRKTVLQQLQFLEKRLGVLKEPLYISAKDYRNNKFEGIDDVKIPIINKTYKLFDPDDRIKIEMISQITSAYVDRKLPVSMNSNHWLKNGIAQYIILEYLNTFLPNLLATGNVTEDLHIGPIKPLKILEASKVKLADRSKLIYTLLLLENYDQAINTPFDELSNYNQKIVSEVKSGLAFQYLAAYLGRDKFNAILREWANSLKEKPTVAGFRFFLMSQTDKSTDWFFDQMVSRNGWFDIDLQKVYYTQDSLQIKIRKLGAVSVPFKLSAYTQDSLYTQWYDTRKEYILLNLPKRRYEKIIINDSIKLPDFNTQNNYYRIDGLFRKKIKFGFITDLPSDEYFKIFLEPTFSWNNYDKLQLGLSIGNRTPLPQKWTYRLKPQYSTGEGAITGGFFVNRNIYPIDKVFRKIRASLGGNYGHYNKGLRYKNISLSLEGSLRKNPRSTRNRNVFINYQQIDRELRETATPEEKERKDYGFLNIGYNYWNNHIIHDRRMFLNLQVSNTFSKLFTDFYYKRKIGRHKTIGVRVFMGAFISHEFNHSDYFDFGLDRITDYTFSYSLLGRSDRRGILSQQFVMAEGGFKSNFYEKSNQLLFTNNWELPIYNIIEGYVDLGYLKNKNQRGKFVYDSGIRVKFIPEFLEIYFPIQSSLGFEPTLGAYHERIRFMLNLDYQKFRRYWKRFKY